MRRASTCVVVLGLALLALPGVVSATPTVTFKAQALPIPGFPHTGDILGAGTDAKLEFVIGGAEYFGSPPPVIGFRTYEPKGLVLHTGGFPTCPEAELLDTGPSACPKGSSAVLGTALGSVTFGGERVEENIGLFGFFSPGGGLEYLADGRSPAVIEILIKGRFSHMVASTGTGSRRKRKSR